MVSGMMETQYAPPPTIDRTMFHATIADCEALAALAAVTFADTFGHLYLAEDLASHLASSCSADYFRRALAKGDSLLMHHANGELIAYAKIGGVEVPVTPTHAVGSQGLHRLYIRRDHQRRGLGHALMQYILTLPRVVTAPAIYLGVWEENAPALALYRRYGFTPVGEHVFMVGHHPDRDIIMMRAQLVDKSVHGM